MEWKKTACIVDILDSILIIFNTIYKSLFHTIGTP